MTAGLRAPAGRALALLALAATLALAPLSTLAAISLVALAAAIFLFPPLGLAAAALGVPFAGLVALPVGTGAVTFTPLILAWSAIGWSVRLLAQARRPAPGAPPIPQPLPPKGVKGSRKAADSVTVAPPDVLTHTTPVVMRHSAPRVITRGGPIPLGGPSATTLGGSLATPLGASLVNPLGIPLVAPLGVFVATLGVAAWRAPDILHAGFEVARWLELGLALVLAASLADAPRACRLVLLAVLAAGTAAALVGILMALQHVGPEAFAILGGRLYRAHGTFGQPNPFGAYMNMVWPLGLALLLGGLPLPHRLLRSPLPCPLRGQGSRAQRGGGGSGALSVTSLLIAITTTTALAALALSWSRGAWLAAAGGAGLMLAVWLFGALRPPIHLRQAALVWTGAVAALLLLLAGATDRLPGAVTGRLASIGETFTVSDVRDAEVTDVNFATVERVAHWQAAIGMWSDKPWLGQGPGQYELVYDRFRLPRWSAPLGHAHNYYLQLLAESGIVGLAGYLAFLGACVLFALRAALRPHSPLQGALGLGLVGVLGVVIVHSLVDYVFVHETTIHLGLLLGLTIAAGGDH